jgi:preprotein translocase subunit SecF
VSLRRRLAIGAAIAVALAVGIGVGSWSSIGVAPTLLPVLSRR